MYELTSTEDGVELACPKCDEQISLTQRQTKGRDNIYCPQRDCDYVDRINFMRITAMWNFPNQKED